MRDRGREEDVERERTRMKEEKKGKENVIHIALSKLRGLTYIRCRFRPVRKIDTQKQPPTHEFRHVHRHTDLHTVSLFVPSFPSTSVLQQGESGL